MVQDKTNIEKPHRVPYAPTQRLALVEGMLMLSADGLQLSEIAERLGVCERTAQRYVRALEVRGIAIQEEREGRRRLLRIVSDRRPRLSLGRREILSLESARQVMRSFHGTGMDEDVDSILEKLRSQLSDSDLIALNRFSSKVRYVDEARHDLGDRQDEFSEIVSATIAEHSLSMRHIAVDLGTIPIRFDPYALLIYRKGIYFVGLSHHHGSIRTFGLDGVHDVRWLKRERFSIPGDFDLSRMIGNAFGLIVGATTDVRLRFDPSVRRYVLRRCWHPTQAFVDTDEGMEMRLRVDGTRELTSWILSFGSKVDVLEPATLREEIRREAQMIADRSATSVLSNHSARG